MATILPNAKQQFIDANGSPLAGGSVYFFTPGTTSPKTTWQDSGGTILNTNPVTLDASGEAIIYGVGIYRQVVYDSAGNLIWDQLTADTSVGGLAWGGTSTGAANAQVIAASSFSQQDGQQISFIAGFSNTGPATVAPGGGTGIPVLLDGTSGPVPLSGGEIVAANEITLVYEQARGAFHLVNPAFGLISGATISGSTILNSDITLLQASDPAPTGEGDIQWSTLFGHIKVGHNGGTDRFLSGPAPGALTGCTIANNASDSTNDIDFGAGIATDSTNAFYLIAAALTKRLDATWAVGTNQGGLFSGSIANAVYHCFIIMRPDTGVVDAGFSTSVTASDRPAAYTYFRRIGTVIRRSAALVGFTQNGNTFILNTPINSIDATNPGTSAVTATLINVPTGIQVMAILMQGANYNASTQTWHVLVSSLSSSDVAPTYLINTITVDDNSQVSSIVSVLTDTSGRVRYRLDFSSANEEFYLTTLGWTDNRGIYG